MSIKRIPNKRPTGQAPAGQEVIARSILPCRVRLPTAQGDRLWLGSSTSWACPFRHVPMSLRPTGWDHSVAPPLVSRRRSGNGVVYLAPGFDEQIHPSRFVALVTAVVRGTSTLGGFICAAEHHSHWRSTCRMPWPPPQSCFGSRRHTNFTPQRTHPGYSQTEQKSPRSHPIFAHSAASIEKCALWVQHGPPLRILAQDGSRNAPVCVAALILLVDDSLVRVGPGALQPPT